VRTTHRPFAAVEHVENEVIAPGDEAASSSTASRSAASPKRAAPSSSARELATPPAARRPTVSPSPEPLLQFRATLRKPRPNESEEEAREPSFAHRRSASPPFAPPFRLPASARRSCGRLVVFRTCCCMTRVGALPHCPDAWLRRPRAAVVGAGTNCGWGGTALCLSRARARGGGGGGGTGVGAAAEREHSRRGGAQRAPSERVRGRRSRRADSSRDNSGERTTDDCARARACATSGCGLRGRRGLAAARTPPLPEFHTERIFVRLRDHFPAAAPIGPLTAPSPETVSPRGEAASRLRAHEIRPARPAARAVLLRVRDP
jgi:hypothetical protein